MRRHPADIPSVTTAESETAEPCQARFVLLLSGITEQTNAFPPSFSAERNFFEFFRKNRPFFVAKNKKACYTI